MISFAGCDYLGLRRDPRVVAAAVREIERSGVGAGASRETTGAHPAHAALEADLADFLGGEAALLLPSGALANLALGCALLGAGEPVLLDPRAHASLRAAVRLAGATPVETPHAGVRVALTDGVLPSRGEIADLPSLLAVLPRDGWLVVDDGHGLGVLAGGRGSVRHHGIADPRVIQVVTLSKALGSAGGAVVGAREVIDLVRRGDLHVGSTALPPAWAAAARASLAIVRDEPARHAALVAAIAAARELLPAAGVPLPREPLPVFRIDDTDAERLGRLSRALAARGFEVPHIRYPDGPAQGYLRLAVTAAHSRGEIAALAEAIPPARS